MQTSISLLIVGINFQRTVGPRNLFSQRKASSKYPKIKPFENNPLYSKFFSIVLLKASGLLPKVIPSLCIQAAKRYCVSLKSIVLTSLVWPDHFFRLIKFCGVLPLQKKWKEVVLPYKTRCQCLIPHAKQETTHFLKSDSSESLKFKIITNLRDKAG